MLGPEGDVLDEAENGHPIGPISVRSQIAGLDRARVLAGVMHDSHAERRSRKQVQSPDSPGPEDGNPAGRDPQRDSLRTECRRIAEHEAGAKSRDGGLPPPSRSTRPSRERSA